VAIETGNGHIGVQHVPDVDGGVHDGGTGRQLLWLHGRAPFDTGHTGNGLNDLDLSAFVAVPVATAFEGHCCTALSTALAPTPPTAPKSTRVPYFDLAVAATRCQHPWFRGVPVQRQHVTVMGRKFGQARASGPDVPQLHLSIVKGTRNDVAVVRVVPVGISQHINKHGEQSRGTNTGNKHGEQTWGNTHGEQRWGNTHE
jgi:hypothetical protein